MDLLCPFVQVFINFVQSAVNFSWTPFAFLGFTAPSVTPLFQLFYPFCTFTAQ